MNKVLQRFPVKFFLSVPVPVVLFILAGISYGLLIPALGFYGDDWSMSWLAYRSHQLQVFFSNNRPQWGFYYEIFSKVIPPLPWLWQVATFIWHWLSAVIFWRILNLLWPSRREMAATAAIFFLLFPGFWLSSVAMTLNVHFFQLAVFLGSFLATIYSARQPARFWLWTGLALVGSVLNLVISEYWFFLELMRPVMIFFLLPPQGQGFWKQVYRAFTRSLIYLAVFVVFLFFRILDVSGINASHTVSFLDSLKSQPIHAILDLVVTIPRDLWLSTFGSTGYMFSLPGLAGRSLPVMVALLAVLAAIAIVSYLWLRQQESLGEKPGGKLITPTTSGYLLAGLACLLLAGWPVWLTNLDFGLSNFTSTRLFLPFIPGACLVVIGIVNMAFHPALKKGIYASLISFAVIFQLVTGLYFVRQTEITESFLWQVALRMPSLAPGTQLLAAQQGHDLNGENAFSAMLNWMYVPQDSINPDLQYFLYQNSDHIQEALDGLNVDQGNPRSHLTGSFSSQYLVAVEFSATTCFRVLDPDLDAYNRSLLPELRRAAQATNYEAIQPLAAGAVLPQPPLEIFGNSTPPDNWCAAFEKASLAAQQGDWAQVTQIGDRAFERGFKPTTPMELIVFIEGYAHQNQWKRGSELLRQAFLMDSNLSTTICHLKPRLPIGGQLSEDKQQFINDLECRSEFN